MSRTYEWNVTIARIIAMLVLVGALLAGLALGQTREAGDRLVSVTYEVRIDGATVHAAGAPRKPAPTERLRVRIWWDWYEAGGWEALGRLGDEHTIEVLIADTFEYERPVWRGWSVTRRWVAADTVRVGSTWQIVLEFEAEKEKVVP